MQTELHNTYTITSSKNVDSKCYILPLQLRNTYLRLLLKVLHILKYAPSFTHVDHPLECTCTSGFIQTRCPRCPHSLCFGSCSGEILEKLICVPDRCTEI